MSFLQAQARGLFELTPEQRTRNDDATAAALRALAAELAHEIEVMEIQSNVAINRRVNRPILLELVRELATRDGLLHEVNHTLAVHVVLGPEEGGDPLACLAKAAGFTDDDPAWLRAVAERLAAKLGKSPADVERVWPARAVERAS